MNPVEDKRRAILDATLRLISMHGFHGTAMSKIAKEAADFLVLKVLFHMFSQLLHQLGDFGGCVRPLCEHSLDAAKHLA